MSFTMSRSRAVVAKIRLKGARAAVAVGKIFAPSRMSPAPAAKACALLLGHLNWGAIKTNSDKPKFFIARAAAPTFSPIWGRESMTAGGVIWRFDGQVFAG